ncbi:helix-turn-helix transcriptional regulator [Rhodococcus hoagii]|nr:helix-turn-helix transcriptional regulator [Prescottella equi]
MSGVSIPLARTTISRIVVPGQTHADFEVRRPGYAYILVPLTTGAYLGWGRSPGRAPRGGMYTFVEHARGTLSTYSPVDLAIVGMPLDFHAVHELPEPSGCRYRMTELPLWMLHALCDWLCLPSTTLDEGTTADAETAVLDLLGQSVPHDADAPIADSPFSLHREAIRVIAGEFHDPDLNAPSLAKRLGVSLRSLHRAFESHSTSISREIRSRRVEQAEILLREVEYAHLTLTEIAHRCGAPSMAYLRLAIKEKHGMSPAQLRDFWASLPALV